MIVVFSDEKSIQNMYKSSWIEIDQW
jgi:hypothetical protein